MALITSTDTIKEFFTIDSSFDFNTVMPYVELAEQEVIKILGVDQYEELNDFFNGNNLGIPELTELLPYAQRPIVYFAFLKGLDKFNVSIGNNGIGVIHNTNLAPASEKRVENLRVSLSDAGYDSLDRLLVFLEQNIDDYPLWEFSDAYAYQHEFLISTARKFDELYKIERSRLTFLNWRPTMSDVELLQINPVVSAELMYELKYQVQRGSMPSPNQLIFPHLQKALAYLTAAKEDNPSKQQDGEHYLMLVKTILDTSSDDYPAYKESSVYVEGLANYQQYENDEESHLGIFG